MDGTTGPISRETKLSGMSGDRGNGVFPVELATSNHTLTLVVVVIIAVP